MLLGAMSTPEISIHALREEGDAHSPNPSGCARNFYPRPPRGGRLRDDGDDQRDDGFLSTPSARRATIEMRANCGREEAISIHALREEGDCDKLTQLADESNFYPRPPRGGRR